MKKVLLMIIYFVLLLGLVGCNNNKNYGPVYVQTFRSQCTYGAHTEVQNAANIWLSSKGNTIKVISTEYEVTTVGSIITCHIMITYQEKD